MALSSILNHFPLVTSATHGTPDYTVNKWLLARRAVVMIALGAIGLYAASRHKPLDIKFFAKYGIALTALTSLIDCINAKVASKHLLAAALPKRPEHETPPSSEEENDSSSSSSSSSTEPEVGSNNPTTESPSEIPTDGNNVFPSSSSSSSSSSSTELEGSLNDPIAEFLSEIPTKLKTRDAKMRAFSDNEIKAYVESSPDNWSQIPDMTKRLLLYSKAAYRLLLAYRNHFSQDPIKTLNFYFDLFAFGGPALPELMNILEENNPLSEDQLKSLYTRILTSKNQIAFESLILTRKKTPENLSTKHPSSDEFKILIQAALPFTNQGWVDQMVQIQYDILIGTPDTPSTPILPLTTNNLISSDIAKKLFTDSESQPNSSSNLE